MLNLSKIKLYIVAIIFLSIGSYAFAENKIGPFWGSSFPSDYRYTSSETYLNRDNRNKTLHCRKSSKRKDCYNNQDK